MTFSPLINSQICTKWGADVESITVSNNKKYYIIAMLAIISLLSVLFIPIYSSYDGIIPEFDDWAFGEIIEEFIDDPEDAFDYYRVSLTIFAFAASLLLLLFAACKSKVLIIITCLGGIISMGYKLIDYIEGYGLEHVLDFESGHIGIGFWIPFILLVICLFYSFSIVSNRPENTKEVNNIE